MFLYIVDRTNIRCMYRLTRRSYYRVRNSRIDRVREVRAQMAGVKYEISYFHLVESNDRRSSA